MKTFKDYLKEMNDYHSVEYYARVGEHGELDNYPTMDKAFKEAIKFDKREKDEDTWYIGVSGNSNEFAIIRINDKYIKGRLSEQDFGDKKDYDAFMKVADKVMKTGKPQKGVFPSVKESVNEDYKSDTKKYIDSVLADTDDDGAKKFLSGLKKFVDENNYLSPKQKLGLAQFSKDAQK